MKIIGIAGTAKNTGKTTSLRLAAETLRKKCGQVILTSIGYDGEWYDNITGLRKPRVAVEEGDLVATALPLLRSSGAGFRNLRATGFANALGRVYVGRATRPGEALLAGPTTAEGILNVLEGAGSPVAIVDGAFSRLAPMRAATHLIIATGAARHRDPRAAAEEMGGIWSIMSMECSARPAPDAGIPDIEIPGGLYLDTQVHKALRAILARGAARSRVFIKGIVDPGVFGHLLDLMDGLARGPFDFVVSHPIYLMVTGDLTNWGRVMLRARRGKHRVVARQTSSLLGFTINPCAPVFDPARGTYSNLISPPQEFIHEIRRFTSAPCTDVVLEGPATLESWVIRAMDGLHPTNMPALQH